MNDRGGLKRAVETESAREYAKQLIRLEADKPKMWGEIEKHMSVESKAQVKLDVEYKKYNAEHNVLSLWRLIKQVHRTQAGKLNVADASLDALTNYNTIKQKESENIVQFKDRLLAAIERIRTVDDAKTPPDRRRASPKIYQVTGPPEVQPANPRMRTNRTRPSMKRPWPERSSRPA